AGLIAHPHDEPSPHHTPGWLMSAPVAVLWIGSIFAGFLIVGGTNSAWYRLLSPVFGGGLVLPEGNAPLSEAASSAVVLVLVLIGIGIAYLRYGNVAALRDAVARLREESIHMPALLTNLFYFDSAIDALFVRPARAFGFIFGRIFDPLIIDGAVREARISATWLGHLFRSFQTGMVRAYALTIVFGAAAFIVYYAAVIAR
ncbi:MAG: hypothetical protein ACREMT_02805, partial [Vulcanimicrobiaceae bacterium]